MESNVIFLPTYVAFCCRRCRYAVRREQIRAHYQKQHHATTEDLRTISIFIDSKLRDVRGSREPRVPDHVDEAIPELPVYDDGLLCEVNVPRCQYICRRIHNMKAHCRRSHGRTEFSRKGRPPKSHHDLPSEYCWREVSCQRLFVSGPGSTFFEVRSRTGNDRPTLPADDDFWKNLHHCRVEVKATSSRAIRETEIHETTPWLDRTNWPTHLRGHDRPTLMASIEPPNLQDPSCESIIWNAIRELLTICEKTATKGVGTFVRQELVNTRHDTHP